MGHSRAYDVVVHHLLPFLHYQKVSDNLALLWVTISASAVPCACSPGLGPSPPETCCLSLTAATGASCASPASAYTAPLQCQQDTGWSRRRSDLSGAIATVPPAHDAVVCERKKCLKRSDIIQRVVQLPVAAGDMVSGPGRTSWSLPTNSVLD